MDNIAYPVVTAQEIESSLEESEHYLTKGAVKSTFSMSDKAGMTSQGVHFVRLEPGKESTTIHYHLNESEWMYVLSGSATALFVDASLPDLQPPNRAAPVSGPMKTDLPVHEVEVKPGDFMGFQAGVRASRWAHGLRAGPNGCDYLCGGDREVLDICVYPLKGIARIFDSADPEKFLVSDYPRFTAETSAPAVSSLLESEGL